MSVREEIDACFARLGLTLASWDEFHNKWSANTTEGYALNFFNSEKAAVAHTVAFYTEFIYLIREKS